MNKMYFFKEEKEEHFYQASEFIYDYAVDVKGKKISLDEYLTAKEQETANVINKSNKNCSKLSA